MLGHSLLIWTNFSYESSSFSTLHHVNPLSRPSIIRLYDGPQPVYRWLLNTTKLTGGPWCLSSGQGVYKKWQKFHSQQFEEVLCWHYIYIEQVTSHRYSAFAYMAKWAHSHIYILSCSKSSSGKQWWGWALEHECSWETFMQFHVTSAILLVHFTVYSLTNLYDI
jgi:hypothetical protein